jgi:uncharacterized membrane protein
LVRHYFNEADAGRADWTAKAAIPAAGAVLVGLIVLTGYRPDAEAPGEAVAFAHVQPIIKTHCTGCHAAAPTNADFPEAPKGVVFDTPEQIRRHARNIEQQAVLSQIMPLGNTTGMTEAERRTLGAWIEGGARVP